jgi:hypothetical protein
MFFNGALWIKDFIFNRDGSKAMISCAEVFFCCFYFFRLDSWLYGIWIVTDSVLWLLLLLAIISHAIETKIFELKTSSKRR